MTNSEVYLNSDCILPYFTNHFSPAFFILHVLYQAYLSSSPDMIRVW